jgi:hypothetical protein
MYGLVGDAELKLSVAFVLLRGRKFRINRCVIRRDTKPVGSSDKVVFQTLMLVALAVL